MNNRYHQAAGTQTLEELCSYLHALSLYQIEGLLSSNRYEAPFSSAELHHEYLIKVCLLPTYLHDVSNPVN